jgi:hypothetical protein
LDRLGDDQDHGPIGLRLLHHPTQNLDRPDAIRPGHGIVVHAHIDMVARHGQRPLVEVAHAVVPAVDDPSDHRPCVLLGIGHRYFF